MIDIRHYSYRELSLYFLNDEGFYKELMKGVRRGKFSYVQEIADEHFIYDDDQLQDLKETFNNELEEYEN